MWTFIEGLKDIGLGVKSIGDYARQKGEEHAKEKKNKKSWENYDGKYSGYDKGGGDWTKLQIVSLVFAGLLFIIYIARGK